MAVHFVGFRDDRYLSARRVWGEPDFFHFDWDVRAQQEIAPGDTVVLATKTDDDPPSHYSFDDSRVF